MRRGILFLCLIGMAGGITATYLLAKPTWLTWLGWTAVFAAVLAVDALIRRRRR